jgi:hypothetical protein
MVNEQCQKYPSGTNLKDHRGFEQINVLSMPGDYRELPISNRCGPADELCGGTDPSNSEYSGTGDVDDEVAMFDEPAGFMEFRYVFTFSVGNSNGVR